MNQNNIAILVAIVGLISTLLGASVTMLGNYMTTRKSNEAEKRRLLRDKIEEMYLLSDELKRLALSYLENTNILINTGLSSELYVEKAAKYLAEGPHLQIDRLKMLVKFYTPFIQEEMLKYSDALMDLEGFKFPFTDQFLKEHKLDELAAMYNRFAEDWIKRHKITIKVPNNLSTANALLLYMGMEVASKHETFQKSIEKLVRKKDAVL